MTRLRSLELHINSEAIPECLRTLSTTAFDLERLVTDTTAEIAFLFPRLKHFRFQHEIDLLGVLQQCHSNGYLSEIESLDVPSEWLTEPAIVDFLVRVPLTVFPRLQSLKIGREGLWNNNGADMRLIKWLESRMMADSTVLSPVTKLDAPLTLWALKELHRICGPFIKELIVGESSELITAFWLPEIFKFQNLEKWSAQCRLERRHKAAPML